MLCQQTDSNTKARQQQQLYSSKCRPSANSEQQGIPAHGVNSKQQGILADESSGRQQGIPAHGHALCEQLLHAATAVHLRQGGLGLSDEASSEGSQAQLGHGAVVQDLSADVHVLHIVLQVTHQHHVPCLQHH